MNLTATPTSTRLRRLCLAAASLAACAVVDAGNARSSVHLTCDNNLRISPPEGEKTEESGGGKEAKSSMTVQRDANPSHTIGVCFEVTLGCTVVVYGPRLIMLRKKNTLSQCGALLFSHFYWPHAAGIQAETSIVESGVTSSPTGSRCERMQWGLNELCCELLFWLILK